VAYQLKCKAIALAAEAQAFKKQEQRLKKWKHRAEAGREKVKKLNRNYNPEVLQGIHLHRIKDVRKEARNALLAYGFVRGLRYVEMENFAWTQPNWDRIEKLAIRYSRESEQDVKQAFGAWKDEALGGVTPKWSIQGPGKEIWDRWNDTMTPGSVKTVHFDPAWVTMQRKRNGEE